MTDRELQPASFGSTERVSTLLRVIASVVLLICAVSACSPRMHIRFREEGSPIKPGDEIGASFIVDPLSIRIAITNFGDDPVQILWHKSSMVGIEGEAMQLLHEGERGLFAAKGVSGEDFSTIPPGATLRDVVYPRRSVHFDDDDEWEAETYLPYDCGATSCEYRDLFDKVVRLSLTLRRGDSERSYDWTFRIVEAFYSTTYSRPPEAE